jgi:hypothetical protein
MKRKTQENSSFWGRKNLSEGVVDNLLEVVFVKQSFQIGATLFRRQTVARIGIYASPICKTVRIMIYLCG